MAKNFTLLRLARLPRFRRAYLFRGFAVWGGIRFVAALAGIVSPNPAQSLLILAAVALAVVLDARRRDEHVFLGNLGIPSSSIAALALVLPLPLEILVR